RTISDTYRSQSQGAPMNREDAWNILCEHTKTEPLRKHALAVEAAMRAYAGKYGGDEDRWAMVGLLHDFDFEMHPNPEEHPVKGVPGNVNRDDITNGAEQLGVNLDEHIAFVIESLKPVASQLGIAGSANTG